MGNVFGLVKFRLFCCGFCKRIQLGWGYLYGRGERKEGEGWRPSSLVTDYAFCIKTWTGLSVEESIRMTEDRDKLRKYVHGVANPGIEDG